MQLLQKISVRKIVVLASVSILIILIIFKTLVNIGDFFRVIQNIGWLYFFLAFATLIPSFFLSIVRWHMVIRAAGFNVSFWKIFKIIGSSLSLSIVPGRLGDLARSYPLRNKIPMSQSIGTIVLEKIIDVCVLIVFSGIGLMFWGHPVIAGLMFFLALGAIPLLGALNLLIKKLSLENGLVNKLRDAIFILNEVKKRKLTLFIAILASGGNWTISMIQIYWLFKAVGSAVPLSAVFAFQPLSIFMGLIPITIAGVGTRDSAILYFFRNFAAPEQSLAVGILYGLQSYWITALLGIPLLYFFFRQKD